MTSILTPILLIGFGDCSRALCCVGLLCFDFLFVLQLAEMSICDVRTHPAEAVSFALLRVVA
jgi:hypothetical protein